MAHFHVQRLSGGFVLTLLIALVGFCVMAAHGSPGAGAVFVAYVIVLASYMNLLGKWHHYDPFCHPVFGPLRPEALQQVSWQPCTNEEALYFRAAPSL